MKTSVISAEFRERYLSNPDEPERLRGPRRRLRRAGGLSPPHRRPVARHRRALHPVHARRRADRLSGRGRGREHAAAGARSSSAASPRCPASATAASPAPRARPRSSTPRRKRRPAAASRSCRPATASASTSTSARPTSCISDEELAERRADLAGRGGFTYPTSQTPWQEIQRGMVDQLSEGMVLKPAVKYQKVAQAFGVPRDNH